MTYLRLQFIGGGILIVLQTVASDADCWTGGATPEFCCVGPSGNPDCWDADYTFERCCTTKTGHAVASPDVAALKIDQTSVPNLPLLSGRQMPISGVGMCCRKTAGGDAARQAVLDYLLMGGRHVDTASLYNNHRQVGEGVRQAISQGVPRSEIFLTSKIWPSDFGFVAATAWVDTMLQELGLPYVDLVLLHKAGLTRDVECKVPRACRQETWLALQHAVRRGQILNLGVSNFGPRQMQELTALQGAPITVNQLEYHPWIPHANREAVDYCHKNGIAVTAYGSMGSANLAEQMVMQDGLKQMGAKYGKTSGQVLLRWAVQKNVSVIPGTSNPKHMAENLRLFDFELSREDMGVLDGIEESQYMLHFGHKPDEPDSE